MSKVTIEDISRHTGLSRGTVSRALNDRPDISQQTKQKVLEACRQLNYVPSHAARSLATGRSFAVAVLVDDLRSTFAACYLRGVIGRARAQRYAVFVCELGAEEDDATQHLNSLARERVDSVLLATPLRPELSHKLVEVLERRPLLSVAQIPDVACDVLMPDYREGGRLIGRRILRDGTPDVLYVHDATVIGADERLAGFHEICRERGVDPGQVTIEIGGPATLERLEPVRRRLNGLRAMAATDDFLAIELSIACQQNGRIPGRDIGLLGQGNELVGSRIAPTLTTIEYGGEEIGRRSMDVALQRVTHARQDAAQTVAVAPLLVERESTGSLS